MTPNDRFDEILASFASGVPFSEEDGMVFHSHTVFVPAFQVFTDTRGQKRLVRDQRVFSIFSNRSRLNESIDILPIPKDHPLRTQVEVFKLYELIAQVSDAEASGAVFMLDAMSPGHGYKIVVDVMADSAAIRIGKISGTVSSLFGKRIESPSGSSSELLTVKVPYRKDRIRFVDKKGIEVVDAQFKLRFIDFEICRRNWAEHVNTTGEFRTQDLKPEETRCVAWRDYAAKPPFVEFFTDPRIRFEFCFSFHCLRPQKAFLELQRLLNNSGWKSYDLG